jgi:hypothetical protein
MPRRRIRTYQLARGLKLIRIWHDDYAVLVQAGQDEELKVGRIIRIRKERPGNAAWLWTITGPAEPGCGIALYGEARDLEAAKSDLCVALAALIDWCDANRDGLIQWTIR